MALAIFISYRDITVVMVLYQLLADMNKNHIALDRASVKTVESNCIKVALGEIGAWLGLARTT
jgi:hypothetical protein